MTMIVEVIEVKLPPANWNEYHFMDLKRVANLARLDTGVVPPVVGDILTLAGVMYFVVARLFDAGPLPPGPDMGVYHTQIYVARCE